MKMFASFCRRNGLQLGSKQAGNYTFPCTVINSSKISLSLSDLLLTIPR